MAVNVRLDDAAHDALTAFSLNLSAAAGRRVTLSDALVVLLERNALIPTKTEEPTQ